MSNANYCAIKELDDYCLKNLDCNWQAWKEATYREDQSETKLLKEVERILREKDRRIAELESDLKDSIFQFESLVKENEKLKKDVRFYKQGAVE